MGGKRRSSDTPKSANGVIVRKWPSGKTTLRISFYYRGVRCFEPLKLEATAANIKYAERLRGEILNAIERGTFSYPDYFPNSKRAHIFGHVQSKITIGELLREFLAEAKLTKEASTYRGYKRVCDGHLLPMFDKVEVQDLQPAILRKWIRGLNCTTKTAANILTPLRAVIEQALVDQYIKENPLNSIIVDKLLNKETKKSDYKPDPFSVDEINAILNESEGQVRLLFQFAFFTGLRVSELIGLRWDDVDWQNQIIHVEETIVYKEAKGPKTEAGVRDVLLLPPALEALEQQKQYTFSQKGRVFHNPQTNKPWETSQQIRRTQWMHILKRAGIRYRNTYQTRHTYASMMLSQGENIMWVSKQLGHVDVEMVIKTYGRWIPDSSSQSGYRPVHDWGSHLG
ncbi:tyrosine-type recombinase/integrase [Legionella pneumophila]|uniref:tyrosine-type recombinase/integrase n=1 Tax=Legionella pneumophila TaxID=446 RepID=UPI0007707E4E|nr:tyrosine-type recombinase/integrase [Legionella pneumophila]CZP18476.1 site-specific tyrosine recombinase XerC [Legionella pneumophila]CZP48367.1 site-specific tyrosine recombinase XerC [Legionella pneumophila]HAT4435219.1 site-specific integrase [Legionella pneumophila]HAT8603983.1 tyrosine-type recombinase/integrase [Legionella pneumophila]HAU0130280.1 site-specific integrase [Legionella pneumophila]